MFKYDKNDYYEISKGSFTYEDENYNDEDIYYEWLKNEDFVLYVDMYNNLLIMEEEICI